MRRNLLIAAAVIFITAACGELPPGTPTSQLPTQAPFITAPPEITPTSTPEQPTATPPPGAFTIQPGRALPSDRPLLAYEVDVAGGKILRLADPGEGVAYEVSFPSGVHFATPFLAGLSPDARYFVYFEGGWLENLYGVEHLRLSTPDLVLRVLDLRRGEVVFSAPLLSPAFPANLAQVAETIKDDWWFTSSNHTFADVIAATEELMLDRMRNVAWSPDSSRLAFAAQDPGPTSELYLYIPENGALQQVGSDPGHILKAVWAPDSSALFYVTSLYDRHAREDTTYLLTREGESLASFTSQVYFVDHWHDATRAIIYGATDSGDMFDLKVLSSADGATSLLWEGSYADIALSPDLSTFLVGSSMPSAPIPPHKGLFLGRFEDGSLLTLSEEWGWGVTWWGSEQFAFAASSIEEGTVGVTLAGERVAIDEGYWRLLPSPDGSYLAGYNFLHTGQLPGILPGLRIFDGRGALLEGVVEVNVICAAWNAASTVLAYQAEGRLYLWQAASGEVRQVAEDVSAQTCGLAWVGEGGFNR